MRLVKKLTAVTLALIFCMGGIVLPDQPEMTVQAAGTGHVVRVGMYAETTTDSRRFSAKTDCASGFEVGYSTGESFVPMFSLDNTSIVILPQVNASFDAATGNCTKGEGNIGAYSTLVSRHSSHSEAQSKAKSLGGFVAITDGGFEVRVNPSNSGTCGGQPLGLTILDMSGKILFTYESTSNRLAIRGKNGASVSFPMLHRSGTVTDHDYTGFFEYTVEEGKLFMVNCLDLEDYTKCVMANEIGMNFEVETRKAFSILARTVPFDEKHAKQGFDVCSHSACCQVYKGLFRMSEENNAIVDSTRGLICAYEGEPILVLYHESSGGATCSSVAAWGGTEIPYLTSAFVDESGETQTWEETYTKQEFFKYLATRSAFSALDDENITMKILETDPYGSDYVTLLSVSDGSGNVVEVRDSEDIRSACGFSSANFDVEYSSDVTVLTANGLETKKVTGVLTADGFKKFDGFSDEYRTVSGTEFGPEKVVITGEGSGHGVGFSAFGAEALAKDGYSYEYILETFFKGTELIKID